MTVLTTDRLRLEPFHERHASGLHAMNTDPEVMRYLFARPETLADTLESIRRVQARWQRWGTSWWSFIEPASGEVVGAGCIQHLRTDGDEPDPACPLEIGWRLRRDHWHQGLASEAAVAMAGFAFEALGAPLLYAVCDPANHASAAVMKRLGMRYRGIERWYAVDVVTYEISRAAWNQRCQVPNTTPVPPAGAGTAHK